MQYISLNNSSLTYFTSKGSLTEMSGSSKYNVIDGQIVMKEKSPNGKIENRSAVLDHLQASLTAEMSDKIIMRMIYNYLVWWSKCKSEKFTNEKHLCALERIETILMQSTWGNNDYPIKRAITHQNILEQNSRYTRSKRIMKDKRTINRSKVKGKMFAMFNLKCSRKFIAFYSVSFPINTSDDQAFECLNYWLTKLRKTYNLKNYIWVTERQKNGTLHYHMLTNNYMPILQINRAMAIIINNKVLDGEMSWGNSSIDRFNGVDVDSIYNSKRHRKTGKNMNPAEIRNWLSKYITKYVTKNSEKFTHLCWHCSRTLSMLFTNQLFKIQESRKITDFLPKLRHLYINYKSDHNNTWIFKFVPPENIFERIRMYNDWLFVEFEPEKYIPKNHINYKTTTL